MVATIHDLVSYHFPETFTLKMRLWQRLFVSNAVRVADCIFADSIATKHDIQRYYDIPEETIKVVYLPVDTRIQKVQDAATLADIRKTYDLPDKFILYLGTLEPRKNVGRLAAAYAKLPESVRATHSLVLAGNLGWYSEGIKREIEGLHLGNRIRLLGYVRHADLPALYTLASAFAYLSLYEGFGAPPLEAMACGTPVICARSSSLPEVVGDAALLVDPLNLEEISKGILQLLSDDSIRKRLISRGLHQATLFTADDKAAEILHIFGELAARNAGRFG
jgi:glycosyltransferase involved in cell wall biosynthesis